MALHALNQQTHLTSAAVSLDHNLNLSGSSQKVSIFKGADNQETAISKRILAGNMSRRTEGRDGLKLELKLNLSPPRTRWPVTESPTRSSPITISPTNSCVSLEQVQDDQTAELQYSSSPETTSMMLAGCPRCLMYVMLAGDYPKCPKCKSTVLLDVVFDQPIKKMRN